VIAPPRAPHGTFNLLARLAGIRDEGGGARLLPTDARLGNALARGAVLSPLHAD